MWNTFPNTNTYNFLNNPLGACDLIDTYGTFFPFSKEKGNLILALNSEKNKIKIKR